jgi:uncharacterized protein (TIGR03083 family)
LASDPRSWIAALRGSQARLRVLVGSLAPDDLVTASYADEWTVAQVLSHLGSQAEIFQMFLDAALSGRPAPGNEAFPPVWDAWNQRPPDAQARDCLEFNDAFITRIDALSDDSLRIPVTVFGMDVAVGDLARMRVSEHALHSWDIAVVFNPTAQVAPDAVTLMIDTLTQLVAWAGKPRGQAFTLRLRTSAPQRDFALAVHERVELQPFSGQAVTGSLDLTAEALLRLVYGRLDAASAPPVELDADDVTLDDLRQVFAGF